MNCLYFWNVSCGAEPEALAARALPVGLHTAQRTASILVSCDTCSEKIHRFSCRHGGGRAAGGAAHGGNARHHTGFALGNNSEKPCCVAPAGMAVGALMAGLHMAATYGITA